MTPQFLELTRIVQESTICEREHADVLSLSVKNQSMEFVPLNVECYSIFSQHKSSIFRIQFNILHRQLPLRSASEINGY